MKKIYLATPYSDDDPKVRQARFEAVNKVAAKMMADGYLVFSPISHTHPIALAGDLPKGWEFWKEYDRIFIEWCDELWVYMQDGWLVSTGVTAERHLATDMKKQIEYIDPKNSKYYAG